MPNDGLGQVFSERLVKVSLEALVLAKIRKEGRICGMALIGWLQNEFGVCISTGRLYPLLHDFEVARFIELAEVQSNGVKNYRITGARNAHLAQLVTAYTRFVELADASLPLQGIR